MSLPAVPIPTLERPAFFSGQRLGADDLTAAQAYAQQLRWLHNRTLHGWGIALGLAPAGKKGATSVSVSAGYALDSAGRELVLDQAQTITVPPVASGTWMLTISYLEDAALEDVQRAGTCGTSGAVRIPDAPDLRFRLPGSADPAVGVREGLDVIVGAVTLSGCALAADVSLAPRQQLQRSRPYVAAGQTLAGSTAWTAIGQGEAVEGVRVTVSTAAAGFAVTPSYQARLAGERDTGQVVYDGWGEIVAPSASAFEFRVIMPRALGGLMVGGEELNAHMDAATFLDTLLLLGWHVVWMGVEL